ncbi:MAG: hypothetical protein KDB90_15220 [Planctomycetes bacterium]|nr:hypothetical protein [Planctomycetota bacterium]
MAGHYDWYTSVLDGMGEAPIGSAETNPDADVVVRYSHFPSFSSAKVIRACFVDGASHATLKASSGDAGGLEGLGLADWFETELSDELWHEIAAWIDDPDLWTPVTEHEFTTFDGDSWLAEQRRQDGTVLAAALHDPLNEPWIAFASWFRQCYAKLLSLT